MTYEAPRAVFVASNATHVRMFADVANWLERQGWEAVFIDLDAHYQFGARSAAAALGRVTMPLDRRDPAPRNSYYHRPVPAIWRDVLRTRPIVRAVVHRTRPAVVVVGNDRGLIERLFITEARSIGARTVLVQDGVLRVGRPFERSIVRRARYKGRQALSRVMRSIDLGDLAAVEYGQGGADLVCATGDEGRAVFLAHGVRAGSIVVTGQPRYDALATVPTAARRESVTWFTTPFAESGIGEAESRWQTDLVSEVAIALRAIRVPFVVRPHPVEDVRKYHALSGNLVVERSNPIEVVLGHTRVAIAGISTVVDEAALAGVPVLVPGDRLHGRRFSALLPPEDSYPRFESASDLVAQLSVASALLVAQQAEVAHRVSVRTDYPSARRVADAIAASVRT